MKCRAQQQGFCLLPQNQITEVEINTPLTTGLLPDPETFFLIYIFPFHFRCSVLIAVELYGHQVYPLIWGLKAAQSTYCAVIWADGCVN